MSVPRMVFDWSFPPGFQTRSDTLLHIAVSCALTLAIAVWHVPILGASAAVLAVGVGKEVVWDWWLGYGSPQVTDLVGDVAGVLAAFVAVSAA